jgi:ribosome biogenesis GTPase A
MSKSGICYVKKWDWSYQKVVAILTKSCSRFIKKWYRSIKKCNISFIQNIKNIMNVTSSPTSHSIFTINDVFDFDFLNKTFTLASSFREDLIKSDNPNLVMFSGNSRVGKSYRLNQLLTRTIHPSGPFISHGGVKSITKNFQ